MRELNLAECEDVSGGMTGDLALQDTAVKLIAYFSSPAAFVPLIVGVASVVIVAILAFRAR